MSAKVLNLWILKVIVGVRVSIIGKKSLAAATAVAGQTASGRDIIIWYGIFQ